jgi:hypothetical protein
LIIAVIAAEFSYWTNARWLFLAHRKNPESLLYDLPLSLVKYISSFSGLRREEMPKNVDEMKRFQPSFLIGELKTTRTN